MDLPVSHAESRRLGSLSPSLAPVWKFQRPSYDAPPTPEGRDLLDSLDADIAEDLRKFRVGTKTQQQTAAASCLPYPLSGGAAFVEAQRNGVQGSDLAQGSADLLKALLQSPAPKLPPIELPATAASGPSSPAANSVARRFGLTPEMFAGPAVPKLLKEQLGLRELYCWWGPTADLPALLSAADDDVDGAFLRLLVLLVFSAVLDPSQPLGREMLEFLRLRDPQGPFACQSSGDVGGGFYSLLRLAADRPVAEHFGTFLVPWAERRGRQVADWLDARLQGMAAASPPLFASLRAIRLRRRIRHLPATHPETGEVKADETECRLQCQGTLLPPIAFLTGEAGQWDADVVLWVAALAQALDSEFQSRMAKTVEEYTAVYGDVAEYFPLPRRDYRQLQHRVRTEWTGRELPRVGNAADGCRGGVVVEAAHVAPLLAALECEARRTGGEALQLQNGFDLAQEEPAAQFGYRSLVLTYRFISEQLTYADIVPHLEEIAMIAFQPVEGIVRWAQIPKVATQRVQLLVQVQVTLPLFQQCDKACHWPCAFTRHATAERPVAEFGAELAALASGLR